jgi:hypothetical protein
MNNYITVIFFPIAVIKYWKYFQYYITAIFPSISVIMCLQNFLPVMIITHCPALRHD